jgi:hypothetical protein
MIPSISPLCYLRPRAGTTAILFVVNPQRNLTSSNQPFAFHSPDPCIHDYPETPVVAARIDLTEIGYA